MEMVVLWGIHIEYASQECVVTAVESASQEPIHWHMEMAVLGEFIISSYEYASQERAVAAVESASQEPIHMQLDTCSLTSSGY